MRTDPGGRVLPTALPPTGRPELWFGYAKPCHHCSARILFRRDVRGVLTLVVQHRTWCPGVEKERGL